MEQYNLKYFEEVYRHNMADSYDYHGRVSGSYMCLDKYGDWVMYSDYYELLSAYKELKHRMEGLEK